MRLGILAKLICLLCLATKGIAETGERPDSGVAGSDLFPATPQVKRQTDFWIKVFQRYKSSAVIIHDPELVDVIIDVVDFESFKEKYNQGQSFNRRDRKEILTRYIERYQLAINRLQKMGKKALEYGPMEQRVLQVYSRRKETLARLFTEEIYLRTQQGMADEFPRAAERAENYLPYMERIFKSRGLPTDLTRIAFVESMFNKEALSKVGASGVWQFMPDTARLFMTVNNYIDERLSPLKASYGAAVLLGENRSLLKSWPLAITAYNHGPNGMQRAVKAVGSRDFDAILSKYHSPSFGFASRNFYSEFLAARHVYKEDFLDKRNSNRNPLRIDRIRLEEPISIHQILSSTPLKQEQLASYNRCLLPRAFSTHRHRPLPKGFEIIVPQEIASDIRKGIRNVSYSQRKSSKANL